MRLPRRFGFLARSLCAFHSSPSFGLRVIFLSRRAPFAAQRHSRCADGSAHSYPVPDFYRPPASDQAASESSIRPTKPASIWIAQAILALSAIGAGLSVFEWLPYGIAWAARAIAAFCFLAALIGVAQFRQPWARWAFGLGAASFWAYSIVRSWIRILARLPPGEPSEQQFGEVLGSIFLTLLVAYLSARILLGEPARKYFEAEQAPSQPR